MSLLLLDTHLLLWAAGLPERLPQAARALIENSENQPAFSAASLWEVVIKCGLGREDFRVDALRLRRGLVTAGYREIAVTGEHAIAVGHLPPLHNDPFDRILIAQSEVEDAELLTADPMVARYPGSIRLFG
jgi:PIN domain nuclease of toxin-antitoxin system